MTTRTCVVSFVRQGQRHEVKVAAQSVYEAAVLAMKAFQAKRYIKGVYNDEVLQVDVEAPLTVKVKASAVTAWLYRDRPRSKDAKERIDYLRKLMADERR